MEFAELVPPWSQLGRYATSDLFLFFSDVSVRLRVFVFKSRADEPGLATGFLFLAVRLIVTTSNG